MNDTNASLRQRLSATLQLVQLVWRAHPTSFVGIAALTFLQAVTPLAAAWITKLIFDLLAQKMGGGAIPWSQLLPLLTLQTAVGGDGREIRAFWPNTAELNAPQTWGTALAPEGW